MTDTYPMDTTAGFGGVRDEARATFLRKTYGHLLGAIVAFTLFELMLFKTGIAYKLFETMMSAPWLLWLGAFMLVGHIATRFAERSESIVKQYVGLGLYIVALVTDKDFSFMRTVLMWGSFAALGFIVVGAIAGFSGGVIFPVLMIALMGGWILHDTSNILLHYPEDRYVGAALALFASVAVMFYYVVILFLRARD